MGQRMRFEYLGVTMKSVSTAPRASCRRAINVGLLRERSGRFPMLGGAGREPKQHFRRNQDLDDGDWSSS